MAAGHILWDASGLVKRYIVEVGSETADAVFTESAGTAMFATPWGYLETSAILRRRYHAGAFDFMAWAVAVASLQADVVTSRGFGFIPLTDRDLFAATTLIDTHHINSADAAILSAYLQFQARLTLDSSPCLLIAADKRFLRAARAEGFATLDPETVSASDVPAFLASL